jgi:hypothetical protein
MMEMLLASAKDIASIKDVVTGAAPATAPVGTTLALQNQALQVFSSIYKRIYRGFHDEFRLMYRCLKRWATDKEKQEYAEITGGDFEQDFSGDGTDIEPVADPTVVTKMQKLSKMQAMMQFAESPIGMASGSTQPGPAQEFAKDFYDVLDVDRPERFIAPVAPNPEAMAKAADMQASAEERQARAGKIAAETTEVGAKTAKMQADTIGVTLDTAAKAHGLHQEAHRMNTTGEMVPPEEGAEGGNA